MEVCEQRFSWYRASALSRARLAIATNNESVENLKDSRKAGGLAREELVTKGGAAAPAPRPKPPTVLPFVPRYTSLQADRAARENDPQSRAELERYLGSTEFEDEVRRSLMPKPAKDDFVKMVKVGENSWVPQRDAQGKLDIDWEKFNAAEKEYKRSMEALQIPQVDELKEIQQKRSTLRRELQKFAQPEALAPKNAGREAALKDNYDRAHDGAVESINAAWANKNKSGPAARESATQVGAAKVEKPGEKKIVPGAADGKEVGFRTSAYSVEALEKMRNQIIEKQKIPKKPGS